MIKRLQHGAATLQAIGLASMLSFGLVSENPAESGTCSPYKTKYKMQQVASTSVTKKRLMDTFWSGLSLYFRHAHWEAMTGDRGQSTFSKHNRVLSTCKIMSAGV